MKNISFALTTQQIIDESKDVTRRLGWFNLKPGDLLQPVRKCMGLKKGESPEILRPPIRVIVPRREPLSAMLDNRNYGEAECIREGFPDLTPDQFVTIFCKSHKGCTPQTTINRIEFAYTSGETRSCACGWKGDLYECVMCGSVGPLCPECHSTTETEGSAT